MRESCLREIWNVYRLFANVYIAMSIDKVRYNVGNPDVHKKI